MPMHFEALLSHQALNANLDLPISLTARVGNAR
jgi:hypothetical protein